MDTLSTQLLALQLKPLLMDKSLRVHLAFKELLFTPHSASTSKPWHPGSVFLTLIIAILKIYALHFSRIISNDLEKIPEHQGNSTIAVTMSNKTPHIWTKVYPLLLAGHPNKATVGSVLLALTLDETTHHTLPSTTEMPRGRTQRYS